MAGFIITPAVSFRFSNDAGGEMSIDERANAFAKQITAYAGYIGP